jgi:hypothetical protein
VTLARKKWVDIESFAEAFQQALWNHKGKYKGSINRRILEDSLYAAGGIAYDIAWSVLPFLPQSCCSVAADGAPAFRDLWSRLDVYKLQFLSALNSVPRRPSRFMSRPMSAVPSLLTFHFMGLAFEQALTIGAHGADPKGQH